MTEVTFHKNGVQHTGRTLFMCEDCDLMATVRIELDRPLVLAYCWAHAMILSENLEDLATGEDQHE